MRARAAARRAVLGPCVLALAIAGTAPGSASEPQRASGTGAQAVTIRDLVELTDIDSLSIAPDGRFAVFRTVQGDVSRNSYRQRWHSVDLASGTVRDIGGGGDPIYTEPGLINPEPVVWLKDGQAIVFRALVDGAIGLWKADVQGHGASLLVLGDADVLEAELGPDGTSLHYVVGATRDAIVRAEQAEADTGILVDETVDLAESVVGGGAVNGRAASRRLVGHWVMKDGLLWKTPRQRRRFDLRNGRDEPIGAPQSAPPYSLPAYYKSGGINARGDKVSVADVAGRSTIAVTTANGRRIVCEDPLCAGRGVYSLAWRPGTEEVIVTRADRALRQSLYGWTVGQKGVRPIASEQGLLNGGRLAEEPCAVSRTFALCLAAGPATPPRVERVNLATGRRTILFDPNAGLWGSYRPEVRFLTLPAGEAGETGAILMLPSRRPDLAPLFINYNRCDGFLRGGEGHEWPMPQLLAAGYAVACINPVAPPGPQDSKRNYEIAIAAVRALVTRLSEDGLVDRTKVAMGGLSFGSEAAFWVAVHSDLLAALSVTAPQWEPSAYWMVSNMGSDVLGRMRGAWGYGAPDETPERWRTMAPVFHTDKLRIPILFQMPELEARKVPELVARLNRQGTPVELYAFPGAAHIKLAPRQRLAAYTRNLDWFRYWLEDVRDPTPDKAAQYARWDKLRTRWEAASRSATPGSKAPAPQAR